MRTADMLRTKRKTFNPLIAQRVVQPAEEAHHVSLKEVIKALEHAVVVSGKTELGTGRGFAKMPHSVRARPTTYLDLGCSANHLPRD